MKVHIIKSWNGVKHELNYTNFKKDNNQLIVIQPHLNNATI